MKIFISRYLAAESPFLLNLANWQAEIIGFSLVDFVEIKIEKLPVADWLFFYSKTAVDFFIKQFQNQIYNYKIACLGEATAAHLNFCYQIHADFIGSGEAKSSAQNLLKLLKEEKICFVQAQNSLQSVSQIIDNQLDSSVLVIYDNIKKNDFENPNADVLVFTSPLNVEAYFDKYALLPKQKVVSIGKTTAQKLNKIGIWDILTAEKPDENHLAKKILEIYQKK